MPELYVDQHGTCTVVVGPEAPDDPTADYDLLIDLGDGDVELDLPDWDEWAAQEAGRDHFTPIMMGGLRRGDDE